jgi:hypothetical protein
MNSIYGCNNVASKNKNIIQFRQIKQQTIRMTVLDNT